MRKNLSNFLFTALLASFICSPVEAKQPSYQTNGSCDGLPAINVETPDGFCVGVVADGFKFTRGIAPLPNGDLVVVDMGGWAENKGSVWLLSRKVDVSSQKISYTKTRLLNNIDRPNGVTIGPDKKIYVGAIDRIFRFELTKTNQLEDVIGGASGTAPLPTSGLHPLKQMIFDHDNNLFVNIGSETNVCAAVDSHLVKGSATHFNDHCPEANTDNPRGTLRKYTLQWPEGKVISSEIYAAGLRNSMALAIQPKTGELWQGENGRDNIAAKKPTLKDAEFPHEEINLMSKGKSYGWPYCYDNNLPNPEYAAWDCSGYTAPQILLPAHASPLAMFFYTGSALPSVYQNSLIIGFHGYRDTGHRLVAYPFTESGKPNGQPIEMMSGWGKKGTLVGAPVDVKMGEDGGIYITEDRNGTVLRLVYKK